MILWYYFGMEKVQQFYQKNALALAYVGDAVFSLMVRNYLVTKHDNNLSTINKKANAIVCARNQAELMQQLLPLLDEQEQDIANRARNAHTNNKAKNSTIAQYHLATEFEAVVGFWHLTGQDDKLNNMFNKLVVGNL